MNSKCSLVGYLDCYAFSSLADKRQLPNIVADFTFIKNNVSSILNKPNVTFHFFSDFCFIMQDLSINKSKSDFRHSFNIFIDLIVACYDIYIQRGLLIKGGIALGEVITVDNILIGKPITAAVRLEQNGIAPIILFPANILDEYSGPGFPGITNIPLKDERVIRASAILPKNIAHLQYLLLEALNYESYIISSHGGNLMRANEIVNNYLTKYI